jgi:HK97 family phage prohead protease
MPQVIYKQARRASDENHTFILSDETRDRYGDIVMASGWQLAAFRKNPVALYAHDSSALPIGRWRDVQIDGKKLVGTLELAETGTPAATPTVEAIRSLLDQKILKSVSVGFLPLEAEPLDKENPWDGLRVTKAELVECSLVPVPANPSATMLRALSALPRETQAKLAASGAAPLDYDRKALLAAIGKPTQPKAIAMSLKDKIRDKRAEIVRLTDELAPLNELLAGDGLSAEQEQEFDELGEKLAAAHAALNRLEIAQRSAGGEAEPVPTRSSLITGGRIAGGAGGTPGVPGVPSDRRSLDRLYAECKGREEKGVDILAKLLAAQVVAFKQRLPLDRAFEIAYPERGDLHMLGRGLMIMEKAATAPAMTTVAGWAAELVQTGYGQFLDELVPASIYGKLSMLASAQRFSFGSFGKIVIPRRNTPTLGQTGDLSGAFVGEGKPIPVRRGILGSVTLTPKKMGVISEFTQEMAKQSIPQIEQIIRNGMVNDTGMSIDAALLDANAETPIRPGGLGTGVVAIPGAAGADEAALRLDLAAVIAPFIAANAAAGLAFLVNPGTKLALTLMTNALGMPSMFSVQAAAGTLAGYPLLDSTMVATKTLWLVRYADFASANNDTPEFSVSDQSTLHEVEGYSADMTAGAEVLPIATGAAGAAVVATPVRSLWQTDSLAIRMILPMDWAMVRAGMVQKVTAITWA